MVDNLSNISTPLLRQVGEDEQKLIALCARARRVQHSDEMVVTKAKKIGKELFAELQPDARKKMLDSIVCRHIPNYSQRI